MRVPAFIGALRATSSVSGYLRLKRTVRSRRARRRRWCVGAGAVNVFARARGPIAPPRNARDGNLYYAGWKAEVEHEPSAVNGRCGMCLRGSYTG